MKWLPLTGAAVTGALAGVAAYTARRLSGPTPRECRDETYTFTPFETNVTYESVSFQALDGLRIQGWWFPQPESNRVIIGCHGHRGKKADLLGIGSGLWRAGYNVLIFDFRGRGSSEDSVCSLAHHEVADLRGAVAYAKQRLPDAQIGVIGYSMGAAVSLLAAAEEPDIASVVADSSFAMMRDVVHHGVARRKVPARLVVQLADHWTQRLYGYRFASVCPAEAIQRIAPRPVLLIHGTNDEVIPVEHSYELYKAAQSPRELWIVQDVPHCGAYFLDRPTYVKRVQHFFDHAFTKQLETLEVA